jgi:hypothetical protein
MKIDFESQNFAILTTFLLVYARPEKIYWAGYWPLPERKAL